MATLVLDSSPCCKKPVTLDLGNLGRVNSSRQRCPHCGEWIGVTLEQYVAYAPGQRGIAWRKTPEGPEPLTLAPSF